MTRPIVATIQLDAFAHNLRVLRRAAAPGQVWAVIKANAYGHGIEPAMRGFAEADGLAMLDLREAVRCRELGWKKPILLLEGFFDASDLMICLAHDLTVVIHESGQIQILETLAPRLQADQRLTVYLKMNSGMNRLGFSPDEYAAAYQRLYKLSTVAPMTLMTHFACADETSGITQALQCFDSTVAKLSAQHSDVSNLPQSLSNSAAILAHAQAHRQWVRAGIAAYGSSPFSQKTAAAFDLRPVMRLSSRIISVQQIKTGQTVGYGNSFTATAAMRIGVVACGYADGYPRHAPSGTPVLVEGMRTQVVGRVSMDMLTVDLTPFPDASVGSPVTLWGGEGLSVDEVAHAAGTIGYELLCALAPRVPVRIE